MGWDAKWVTGLLLHVTKVLDLMMLDKTEGKKEVILVHGQKEHSLPLYSVCIRLVKNSGGL